MTLSCPATYSVSSRNTTWDFAGSLRSRRGGGGPAREIKLERWLGGGANIHKFVFTDVKTIDFNRN